MSSRLPPAGGTPESVRSRRVSAWLADQREGWRSNVRLLGRLRAAGPPGAAFVIVSVLSSLYSAVRATAIGIIIGRVGSLSSEATLVDLVGPLALFGGILLFEQVTSAAVEALGQVVARRVEGNVRREVRAALAGCVGISVLEEPSTQNDIAIATAGASGATMSGALFAASGAASSFLALFASGLIVAELHILLAAAYIGSLLIGRSLVRAKSIETLAVQGAQSPLFRRRAYIGTLHR